MKNIIAIVLVVFSINVSSAIDWVRYENLEYAIECTETKSIVILLHGANVHNKNTGKEDVKQKPESQKLIQGWLDKCALVVLPDSMVISYDGETQWNSWDFTGESSQHEGIDTIKDLVIFADSFDVPVVLVGGSAGALMAYRVASELVMEGIDVIDALVLLEVMSPYALSIYTEDAVYVNSMGIAYHPVQNTLGEFDVWSIPTIIGHSIDDSIMPDEYKQKFIGDLAIKSIDLEIVRGGTNHLLNDYAMVKVTNFILERL